MKTGVGIFPWGVERMPVRAPNGSVSSIWNMTLCSSLTIYCFAWIFGGQGFRSFGWEIVFMKERTLFKKEEISIFHRNMEPM